LKDSFQATYILDNVIEKTDFPDVISEAKKNWIKTEESKDKFIDCKIKMR
jgi:hypothetical protein